MNENGHKPLGTLEPNSINPTNGLPVAPSLDLALADVQGPPTYTPVDRRVIAICALALGIGAGGALVATILTHLIGLITNIAYFGRLSGELHAAVDRPVGRVLGTRSPSPVR